MYLKVPYHKKKHIFSDLYIYKLPTEGIHFILGNGLVGSRVWTDTHPSPVVTFCPSDFGSCESSVALPEVSSSCVVTHCMSKSDPDVSPDGGDEGWEVPSLSELPLSLSHSEAVQEQHSDPSLNNIFEHVLPTSEISNAANGYFSHNDLLFRKWVPDGEDCVKSDVFQMVMPVKSPLPCLESGT